MSRSIRRAMIDRDHQQLSLVRQCILLDVTSVYYRPVPTRAEDLELMALMDRQYLKTPFYGSRKMKAWLLQQGYLVSRKRVRRLMRLMGLEAIYRRPNTSKPAPGHRIFPYLLKGVEVNRVDQVWAADITYIPMAKGFLYLVAIMDWHSRHVLAWKLSNTMDTSFCVAALEEALGKGRPEIFNTDQGSQFTSEAFTQTLQEQRVLRPVGPGPVRLTAINAIPLTGQDGYDRHPDNVQTVCLDEGSADPCGPLDRYRHTLVRWPQHQPDTGCPGQYLGRPRRYGGNYQYTPTASYSLVPSHNLRTRTWH